MKIKTIEDLDKLRKAGLKSLAPKQLKISISMSSCGYAMGADILYHTLIREREKQGLKISIGQVGCSGFCNLEPMVVIRLHGRPTLLYTQMTEKKN
jgi:predicted metal-binding protein